MKRAAAIALALMSSSPADARSPSWPGTLVESGVEKGYRFETLIYPSQTRRSFKHGRVSMRTVDISNGPSDRWQWRGWRYLAWCEATETRPARLYVRAIHPADDKNGTEVAIAEGPEPSNADRTWYNVWYAACRGEFNRYPRNQD